MKTSIRRKRRAAFVRVLAQLEWNILRAAKHLSMTRQGVYYRMKRYKVRRPGPVDFAKYQAQGGHARAKKLSKKERLHSARKASRAALKALRRAQREKS